jgi:hypothetical protein
MRNKFEILILGLSVFISSCTNNEVKNPKSVHIVYKGKFVEKEIKLKHINERIKKKIYAELNVSTSNKDDVFMDVYAICHFLINTESKKADTIFFRVETRYFSKKKTFLFSGSYKFLGNVSKQ